MTDPELLVDLADYLHALGCADVAVVEAPNIYDQFYAGRSVGEVARYFGLESASYRLVDLSDGAGTTRLSARTGTGDRSGGPGKRLTSAFRSARCAATRSRLAYLSVGNVEWIGADATSISFPSGRPSARPRS